MDPKLNIHWSCGNTDYEREDYCITEVLSEALYATGDHQIIILLCHISLKSKLEKLASSIFHQCITNIPAVSTENNRLPRPPLPLNPTTKKKNNYVNPDKVHLKYVSGLYAASPAADYGASSDVSSLVTGCHVAASLQYLPTVFIDSSRKNTTQETTVIPYSSSPTSSSSSSSPSSSIHRLWLGYIGIDIPSNLSASVPSNSTNNSTFNLSYFQRFLSLLSYIPPNPDANNSNSTNNSTPQESLVSSVTIGFRYLNPQTIPLPDRPLIHPSVNDNNKSNNLSSASSSSFLSYQPLLQLLQRYYE